VSDEQIDPRVTLIAQSLRDMAPLATTDRLWGRMSRESYREIHGVDMEGVAGAEGNAWAGTPEDVATRLVEELEKANLLK
jgi:hypothetical protein